MYRGARHVLGVSGPACRLGPGPAGPVAKREAIGCRGVSIGSHFLHDALAMSADLVIAIVILTVVVVPWLLWASGDRR